jgi:uncharacterized coiled-coil DUF342 family protein
MTLPLLFSICRALERKRTITSVSIAEERQILKEIKVIQKSKTAVDEYNAYDKQVQETKVSKNTNL